MYKNGSILTLGLLAMSLGMTSCASSTQARWKTPGDHHPIAVAEQVERLDLVIHPGDAGLTLKQKAAVAGFARAWLDYGHGPLAVSLPAHSGNGSEAVTAAAETRQILYTNGLDYQQIAGGHYEAAGNVSAPVVLSFRRYVAEVQGCDAGTQNLSPTFNNQVSKNFGCALAVNTAAMIADPHDLIAPRGTGPSSADRRIDQLDKYVKGEDTAAKRSDEESGTVSDVSNN